MESDCWTDPKYIDQSMTYGFVSSFYTPWGIKGLDTKFCKRILNAKTIEELKEIDADLMACPNLHKEIKENLVINLNTYYKILNQQAI